MDLLTRVTACAPVPAPTPTVARWRGPCRRRLFCAVKWLAVTEEVASSSLVFPGIPCYSFCYRQAEKLARMRGRFGGMCAELERSHNGITVLRRIVNRPLDHLLITCALPTMVPTSREVTPRRSEHTMRLFLVLLLGCLSAGAQSPNTVTPHSNETVSHSRIKKLLGKAERGDSDAQFEIAVNAHLGRGMKQDVAQALHWLRRAAGSGHAAAENWLGVLYESGKGVSRDAREASRWYLRAAVQGFGAAQANIGRLFADGNGVPQDDAEAVRWFERAIKQGNAPAMFLLAQMYRRGRGVSQDDTRAAQLLRVAAEKGLAEAENNLGYLYEHGAGVPQDQQQAVYWIRKAAEHGVSEAQFNLAVYYRDGRGVEANAEQALFWMKKAAESGLQRAALRAEEIGTSMAGVGGEDGAHAP